MNNRQKAIKKAQSNSKMLAKMSEVEYILDTEEVNPRHPFKLENYAEEVDSFLSGIEKEYDVKNIKASEVLEGAKVLDWSKIGQGSDNY